MGGIEYIRKQEYEAMKAEIERLRTEVEEMRTRIAKLVEDNDCIPELEAEIERLQGALTVLAILGEQGMKPNYKEWLTFHDKVAQVARTALEPNAHRR